MLTLESYLENKNFKDIYNINNKETFYEDFLKQKQIKWNISKKDEKNFEKYLNKLGNNLCKTYIFEKYNITLTDFINITINLKDFLYTLNII